MQTCSQNCPGGQGTLCGETSPQGPNGDIFVKVCTCYCPPQSCTTTPSPFSIALFKLPVAPLLIKKKIFGWKAVLTKVLKFCLIAFKICSFYLLKVFFFLLFYFGFNQWIDWEIQTFFRTSRWALALLWNYWTGNN
jgi:hypothetical protein